MTFNLRVRFLNWRLRPRKCLVCSTPIGTGHGVGKDEHRKTPIFCAVACRDDWHATMQEI